MAEPIKKYIRDGELTKGHYKTRMYRTWLHMKERCGNPNNNRYYAYGARGIKVCDEWINSFHAFFKWAIANGYAEDLTIDRIDSNGNYCPDNCRWVDIKTQQNNKRTNRRIEFNGRTLTLAEWAKEIGLSDRTILFRLNKGMKPEEILTAKKTTAQEAQKMALESRKRNKNYHSITINGEEKSLTEWADCFHISRKTVVSRIHRGWDEISALTKPLIK